MRKNASKMDITVAARGYLEPVGKLAAALVVYLDGPLATKTMADLYGVATIATNLRRAFARQNTVVAVNSILDKLNLPDEDRKKIENYIQPAPRRRRRPTI